LLEKPHSAVSGALIFFNSPAGILMTLRS
jgi:hypothetical protein